MSSQTPYGYGQVVDDPLAHFRNIAWCEAIMSSPDTVSINIPSRHVDEGRGASLVNETLNTPDTVRACIVVEAKRDQSPVIIGDDRSLTRSFNERICFLDIGSGVNGYPGMLHGGFFNVMLDEIMGSTVNAYKGDDRLAFTASLNMKFKKPLFTPQVVVVRATIKSMEGRKIYVSSRCDDMNGEAFAEAEGMWVTVKMPNQANNGRGSKI